MQNDDFPLSIDKNASPDIDRSMAAEKTRADFQEAGRAFSFYRHSRFTEILPLPHFLGHLRRERLRADRSKGPLSIAVFCFDDTGDGFTDQRTQRFLDYLETAVRETDILGYVGQGRIALLLLDTDAEGRKAYVRKLLDGQRDLPVSVLTGTYPDQIFQRLMAENPDHQEPDPFFLDLAACRHRSGYALKRTLDIIGAVVGIALFSPLMLLAALAIKTTSPGPIIFRQTRLGENGHPFVFYKFRSMSCDADDQIHRDYVASLIAGSNQAINQGNAEAPLYKLKSDPRVTWIGRLLRKTSMDELPQFFNVLKGDMSLVGPRPPLPYEVEKYQSWHLRRIFEMKPGITGLWQVEGRSRTSFDDMVRLDLEYIRKCSLGLDLKILLKTFKVVLQCVGAT